MNGLAMTAGSNPSLLASIGSVQPTIFALSLLVYFGIATALLPQLQAIA